MLGADVLMVYLKKQQKKSGPSIQSPQPITPPLVNSPSESEQRIFIDITPEQLVGYSKQYNTIQADQIVKTHIGKWMRFSGRFNGSIDRDKEDGSVKISIFPEPSDARSSYVVMATFTEQRWIDRAVVLGREEAITIVGRIRHVTEPGIMLERCEIVE